MPRYTNTFRRPTYHDEVIVDPDGNLVGTIRLKPSGILWKPAHAREFFSIPLEAFVEWIENPATAASKVKY